MRPSTTSRFLKEIADRLESSKPDRRSATVALRSVLSSLHSSGDPDKPGGYALTLKVLPKSTNEDEHLSVNGKIEGTTVSGKLTIHIQNGEYSGWGYVPDPGTADLAADPEGMLQVVLDAASEELQLS